MKVIDLASERRRREGFQVLAPDEVDFKVWRHDEARAQVTLTVGDEQEELLLHPSTLRAWAAKMLAVADQIDAPAPRLALVEEA